MDEVSLFFAGLFIFLATVIGGAMYCSNQEGIRNLQCVQAIHDKPAAEIKVVCG